MTEKDVYIPVSRVVRDRIKLLKRDMTYTQFFITYLGQTKLDKDISFNSFCDEIQYG